jgi:hypothetical protein
MSMPRWLRFPSGQCAIHRYENEGSGCKGGPLGEIISKKGEYTAFCKGGALSVFKSLGEAKAWVEAKTAQRDVAA